MKWEAGDRSLQEKTNLEEAGAVTRFFILKRIDVGGEKRAQALGFRADLKSGGLRGLISCRRLLRKTQYAQ
ncbi:MAG: hypothetical protein ACYDA9_11340 [Terriglobia bacterium]